MKEEHARKPPESPEKHSRAGPRKREISSPFAQGSWECNISFVIEEQAGKTALNTAHREFRLDGFAKLKNGRPVGREPQTSTVFKAAFDQLLPRIQVERDSNNMRSASRVIPFLSLALSTFQVFLPLSGKWQRMGSARVTARVTTFQVQRRSREK